MKKDQNGRDGQKLGRVMKHIKRILVTVLGGTVLVVGIALIVLPGPAFIVIPAGLAILAIEFAWARRWLNKPRALLRKYVPSVSQRKKFNTLNS